MSSVTSPSRHVSDKACQSDTWYHDSAHRPFPLTAALEGLLDCSVAIIGAGFTGVSAALDLAEAGHNVLVLEANTIGAGASGRNGGLACSGWRHDQSWLENRLGKDDARNIWALAEDAKADLLARIARHKIDADWQSGQIFAAHTQGQLDALNAEAEHMARAYDVTTSQFLDKDATAKALGTDVYYGGWRDGTAGHVHPLKLLYGLADAAQKSGAVFYENTRALEVTHSRGGGCTVRTPKGTIHARHVLLCGDGYLDGVQEDIERRVLPIGSFVLATAPLDPALNILPQNDSAMDTRFVVNYWRKSHDDRLIFGGGEKYTPAWPTDVKAFVRENMIKIYPQLADVEVTHAWGGALGITPTRLPFIRKVGAHMWTAAGYSGQGVVLAPYFGRLLAQAVDGQLGQFDLASRLPVPHFPGGRMLRWPLLTAAMSYYALRDKLP
jgi:gamma-glutamylputrescine oxidase